MTTIPKQRIYEGYLLSGERRVFFLGILVRYFLCSVGFHVNTNVVIRVNFSFVVDCTLGFLLVS